jgi:hypothetical protein
LIRLCKTPKQQRMMMLLGLWTRPLVSVQTGLSPVRSGSGPVQPLRTGGPKHVGHTSCRVRRSQYEAYVHVARLLRVQSSVFLALSALSIIFRHLARSISQFAIASSNSNKQQQMQHDSCFVESLNLLPPFLFILYYDSNFLVFR